MHSAETPVLKGIASGRELLEQARVLAKYLSDQPDGWLAAHHLMKSVRLDTVSQLPPPDGAGRTRLVPPKSDYRAQLKRLYLQQSWTELIELTDSLFVEGVNHFWLDVQWYLHQALMRAGSPWDKNAAIIISDLKMLLHRMPGLETLAFNDGTPFADDVTREWIARDVLQESDWQTEKIAAVSAGADDDILLLESEALTLADSEGVEAALAWLQARPGIISGRQRWLRQLLMARLTEQCGRNDLALHLLGELNTMVALIFCIAIIAPRFRRASKTLGQTNRDHRDELVLKIVRILLQLVPVGLIVLVVLGYYYTALNLINHMINTYIAWVVWSLARHTIYRAITVSSRRLAYRRVQEKRQQKATKANDGSSAEDVVVVSEQEEGMAVNQVRSQLLRFADLFIWTALFAIFYYVWSDLVTVVSYLRDITLWQQTTTTETGVVTESISLFNLIVALVIIGITYILVRNLPGILEVLIFSRVKLSQGTPYTINTLLTYTLVAIGSAWAFATLGMSWSKLQWLFAALSVGLGFGMQEIFANFVSGIILLFERPIRVGDTVTINDVTGTVAKIRIRAITIIDPDRKEVIVPNKSFVTGQVTNWALSNTITRVVISIGVAYGSDLDLVKRLLLKAASEQANIMKDPEPRALFLSFGASTLDHELRVYVSQVSERTNTIDALNRRINELFAENNIEIAFNQLDVFIKNQDTGAIMPLVEVKS